MLLILLAKLACGSSHGEAHSRDGRAEREMHLRKHNGRL
jgi:hypothetical protein